MYITGIGRTKFGVLNKTLPELAYNAIYSAIKDSPISITDIDAVSVSNFLGGPYEKQLHLGSVISGLLPECNIPIIRIETACASGGSALHQGLMSLHDYENVLIVGVEKMTRSTNKETTLFLGMAGDRMLDQQHGLIFPANYALIAQQHMIKYGTTHDDLALRRYVKL
jgi:acetyl-CoA C-acetyltransferase